MTKVLWLSRHELGEDQLCDLKNYLDDIQVESRNVLWNASGDESSDTFVNEESWNKLFAEADVICGVFPPVALESLRWANEWINDPSSIISEEMREMWSSVKAKPVLSPVSKQEKKIREDGNAQIEFKHLRWCKIFD